MSILVATAYAMEQAEEFDQPAMDAGLVLDTGSPGEPRGERHAASMGLIALFSKRAAAVTGSPNLLA